MRGKLRRAVDVPAPIKGFIDTVIQTPFLELSGVLDGFVWTYEKGDIYHWASLFNHFDSLFDKHIKHRSDIQLDDTATDSEPFPARSVEAILKVAATIFENCSNKHNFDSYEIFSGLLAAPVQSTVIATLTALVAFVRKTHTSSMRFHGDNQLNSRLLATALGWGGREEGLELAACVLEDQTSAERDFSVGTRLHFEFYQEPMTGAQEPQAGGSKVIDVPGMNRFDAHPHAILNKLVPRYGVPQQLRYQLLTRIRIARAFDSVEGRRYLVKMRLLAFYVLFQSSPSAEDMAAFLSSESEFVPELVQLLQSQWQVPEDLRTLALRALAVQLLDRSRHAAVIGTISTGGHSGLLSQLMHSTVAEIAQSPDAPSASSSVAVQQHSSDAQAKHSIEFVDALLTLVGSLVASASGCTALSDAGVIPALLPLISDSASSHIRLVCAAVRILEAFMDFSPTSAGLFRDLGGLAAMIERLQAEVGLVDGRLSAAQAKARDKGKQPADEGASEHAVAYSRRLLLKSLLRAIALASYAPGSAARPQEADTTQLFACLKVIFERAKEFGGGLFALAASVMTDLIHHEPLCFRALDDAGLPEAFISAIQAEVVPSGEALCAVPNTLVALCLNTSGLDRVRNADALSCFVPMFTTRTYLKALSGDTPSILGSGLDELMRHVPNLRLDTVNTILKILHRILELGRGQETSASSADSHARAGALPTRQSSGNEAAGSVLSTEAMNTDIAPAVASSEPVAMETEGQAVDGSSSMQEGTSSVPDAELARANDASSYLPECINFTARMLESLFADTNTSREFVERGGIEALLAIYTLPKLPPTFGSSAPAQALVAAMRSFTSSHADAVSSQLNRVLMTQLQLAVARSKELDSRPIMEVPAGARQEFLRMVSAAEGLVGLGATVARNAPAMLLEVSRGTVTTLSLLSQLERIILWQLAAEEWKQSAKRQDAAKPTGSAEAEGAQPSADGPADMATETPDLVDVEPVASEGRRQLLTHPLEEPDLADTRSETDAPDRDAAALTAGSGLLQRGRKKSLEEVSLDIMLHFCNTVKVFYVHLAKAVHTPSRRRDELAATPSMNMQAAAVGLGVVLRDNIALPAAPGPATPGEAAAAADIIQYAHYFTRVVEELMAVLFDTRRRTCHSLVLNYFVAGGGLNVLVQQFAALQQVLWQELALKRSQPEQAAGSSQAMDTSAAEPSTSSASGRWEAVESAAVAFLLLMDQLALAPLLLGSPRAPSLLVAPVPGTQSANGAPTASDFVKRLQSTLLQAVLPLWLHPELSQLPNLHTPVISILTSCTEGPASSAAAAASRAPAAPPALNPSTVQQIVDMGFSMQRAEAALRRVGHDSVEFAMEWLISHPEEPAAAAPAAAAAPVAAADDDALASTLSASLASGTPEPQPEASQQQPEIPGARQLVDGASAIASTSPSTIFSLALLLSTLCSRDGGRDRRTVVAALVEQLTAYDTDAAVQQSSQDAAARKAILAPAHLLAVLVTDDPQARQEAADQGMFALLLRLLKRWTKQHVGKSPPEPVPAWVDALLLATDAALQTPPPKPAAAQPPAPAASSAPAAPASADPAAASADASAAADAPAGAAAAPAPDNASAGNAADAQQVAAPEAQPSAAAAETSNAAPASQAQPAEQSLEQIIQRLDRPGGLLSAAEQRDAGSIATVLLKHLHAVGKHWKPPAEGSAEDNDGPASATQAVLQVLARVTKSHALAMQFLSRHGPMLLLELPTACFSPVLETHMSAIMRHMLEDPATLQSAMEAEILSTIATGGRARQPGAPAPQYGTGSMTLRQFLTTMGPVLAREPNVFLQAMYAVCSIDEASGRAMLVPKKKAGAAKPTDGTATTEGAQPDAARAQATPAAQTPAPSTAAATPSQASQQPEASARSAAAATPALQRKASGLGATPKTAPGKESGRTSGKSQKKTVPNTFVEVIDCLVDFILRHKPAAAASSGTAAMDTDAPSSDVHVLGQQQQGSGQGPAGLSAVLNSFAGGLTGSGIPPSPLAQQPPAASGNTDAPAAEVPKAASVDHGTIMQCVALKMLTDFTLMYGACVGVLLRRDTDLPSRSSGVTPAKAGLDAKPATGLLFRHVMQTHLNVSLDEEWVMTGLREPASFFLMSVCIRSAEGRRRIISEVVDTLSFHEQMAGQTSEPEAGYSAAELANAPFMSKNGWATPCKVKTFVELVGSLLSASGSPSQGLSSRPPRQGSGASVEMARAMKEGGVIKALTNALALLDLDHPKAVRVVGSILKPLEMLVRPLPPRHKDAAGQTGRQSDRSLHAALPDVASGGAEGPAATDQRMRDASAAPAAGQDAQMGEPDDVPEESAAGPEARAEAERARQAYEREHGHLPEAMLSGRAMEDVVEAMMEHAYNQEAMQEYTSESDEDNSMGVGEEDESSDEGDDDDHDDEDEDDEDEDEDDHMHDNHYVHDAGQSVEDEDEDEEDQDEDSDEGGAELALELEEDGHMDAGAGTHDDQLLQMDPSGLAIELDDEQAEQDEDDEEEDAMDEAESDEEDEEADAWRIGEREEEMDEMEDGDVPSITIPWGPAGIRAGGIQTNNLIGSTQAMLGELLSSTLNRGAGAGGRRRYRIFSRREPGQSVPVPAPAFNNLSSQHQLLQRPLQQSAAGQSVPRSSEGFLYAAMSQLTAEANRLGLQPSQLLQQDPGRDLMMLADNPTGAMVMALSRGANAGQQLASALGGGGATSNAVLQMSMDALLGNMQGSGARTEARMPSWAEAGQPGQAPATSTAARAAVDLEQHLLGSLHRENVPVPAPAAQPTPAPAAAPAGTEGAAAPNEAAPAAPTEAGAAAAAAQLQAQLASQAQPQDADMSTGNEPAEVPPAQQSSEAAAPQPQQQQQLGAAQASRGATPAPEAPANMAEDAIAAALASAMAAVQPLAESMVREQAPEPVDQDSDEEMQEAASDSIDDDEDEDQDEDMGVAEEGNAGTGLDAALARVAEDAGIELAFLEALPPELRAEVLSAHGVAMPAPTQATPPAPTPAPTPTTSEQPLATPSAPPPADEQMQTDPAPPAASTGEAAAAQDAASAQPAADAAAQQSGAQAEPAPGPAGEAAQDEFEGIDPEFISALPPDIQAEVLEQQRRDRRRRQAAAQRAAAQQAAQASGGARAAANGAEMDMASILATFPPEVREEVLQSADEQMLASLPPALLAEAQTLRERAHRIHRDTMMTARRTTGTQRLTTGGQIDAALLTHRTAFDGRLPRPDAWLATRAGYMPPGASQLSVPQETDGQPQVDEEALMNLVATLRLPIQIGKGSLPRLFLNLTLQSATRAALLRILLALLRLPLSTSADGDAPAAGAGSSMAIDDAEAGSHSLDEALQAEPSSSHAADNALVSLLGSRTSGRSGSLPPHLSRRILELLTTLARHQQRLASEAVCLDVPDSDTFVRELAARQDRKGKSKAPDAAQVSLQHGLEVVLELLGSRMCRRSNTHLDQALHLVDVLLQGAKAYGKTLLEIEKAKAAQEEQWRQASQRAQQQQREREEEAQRQQAAAAGGPSAAAATAEQPTVQPEAAPAEPPTPAPVSVPASSAERPAGPPTPQAGDAGPSPSAPLASEQQASALSAVLHALPQPLVGQLPALLGQRGLSDQAYIRISAVMRLLVEAAPEHKQFLLSALQSELVRLSELAQQDLAVLAAPGEQPGSAAVAASAGLLGGLMLRILQSVRTLARLGLPRAPPSHATASVEATAGMVMDAQDIAALDSIGRQTERLWTALSRYIAKIEAALQASAADQPGTQSSRVLPPGAAQVLPLMESFFVLADARIAHMPVPEGLVSRANSIVELSRESSVPMELVQAPTETPEASAAASSSAAAVPATVRSTPQASRSTTPERQAVDVHMPFLRFAEKHRALVNVLLRHNAALLQGSLAPLLRAPRLIDFDNKRAFFRTRVRAASSEERHYSTLRISVRRSHVFEDSFHQLRMRLPEEMRAKLSVQFQGEEGIDAGGVSREWYQVMAREMFNPNFSLFVPTPEGGTTFQPNPNSVVQNDEARGTNHLDFFKFVGRVVGKALYDGQFIDAYFTRSFYKHMLGQPLTYQDIEAVDPDFYKNLRWMLENEIADVLDLTFTEETDYFGRKELVELKPDGAGLRVTDANKREYVNLVAQHRMTTVIRSQINAFLQGFWDLVPKDLISMFNDHELELLISGLPEIDVADLRANTEYTGYTAASTVVQWFWEIVNALDKEDLALLVQFVTGTSKVPLDGFKALQGISGPQKFQIHKAYGPSDRLPSAHTCFNQLDLIEYDTKDNLQERLLMAVHEGSEGFGFG